MQKDKTFSQRINNNRKHLFVYETQAIQEIEELAQSENSVRKFKRTRA